MEREEVLEYETRKRVFDLVRASPGLHLREIERRSGLPLSTLRHHLSYLERHGLVEPERDRNFQRYFASDLAEADRPVIAALRQVALRRVLLYLLSRAGGAPYQDLLGDLALPASTLAVHLAELARRGLIERRSLGRESRYEVVDAERIVRALHVYRPSFLDALVDHLLDAAYQEGKSDR